MLVRFVMNVRVLLLIVILTILQNGRKRIARLALRYGANINHQVNFSV